MSELTINVESLIKNNVSLCEALCLIGIANRITKTEFKETIKTMYKNGMMGIHYNNKKPDGYNLVDKGTSLLNTIIIDSAILPKRSEFEETAVKLKALWPKGKRPDANVAWAESPKLITIRLQQFFVKYCKGTDYTLEDIYNKAKEYVESFNGNHKYMRSLKYFIFRDRGITGDANYDSPLLDMLEGNTDTINKDWDNNIL